MMHHDSSTIPTYARFKYVRGSHVLRELSLQVPLGTSVNLFKAFVNDWYNFGHPVFSLVFEFPHCKHPRTTILCRLCVSGAHATQ